MKINIFWFRRDLRLHDNAGLYHALKSEHPILPLFIFDTSILDKLQDRTDARVSFIHETLTNLKSKLEQKGSTLLLKYGNPTEIWQEIIQQYDIHTVFTNHDYEPYAIQRDTTIKEILNFKPIRIMSFLKKEK